MQLVRELHFWGAICCLEVSLASVSSVAEKLKDAEATKLPKLLEKWNMCAQLFKQHGPLTTFESSIRTAIGKR